MESYNVKLTEYAHTSQIKMYSRNIQVGKKRRYKLKRQPNSIERTQKQIERSLQSSINRTKSNIYSYALSNDWQWFCTFTFNPKIVISTDYNECVRAFSNWLQNCHKRKCNDMVYLVVPEYHKDKQKFHFHALMSNINELTFVDSGYQKNGRTLYNIFEYELGFSTAVRLDYDETAQAKVCNYMLKYVTKDLVALSKGKKRYWVSRTTINKPIESFASLDEEHFGAYRTLALDNCTFTKTIDINYTGNRVNIFNI